MLFPPDLIQCQPKTNIEQAADYARLAFLLIKYTLSQTALCNHIQRYTNEAARRYPAPVWPVFPVCGCNGFYYYQAAQPTEKKQL
ncbi:hypothetical protein BWD07_09190 [Neisseria canis]|nr:hypothetical protein BWD07_09190 [Neisseria canis]